MSQKITVNFTPEVGANMRKNGINRGKVKKSQGTLHLKDGNSTSHCLVVTREQKSLEEQGPHGSWLLSFRALWPDLCLWFCAVCSHPLQASGDLHHSSMTTTGMMVWRGFSSVPVETELSPWQTPQKHCRYENSWDPWSHRPPEPFAIPGWCCFLETSDGPWPREGSALVLCLLTAPGYPQLLLEGRDPPFTTVPPVLNIVPDTRSSEMFVD